MFFSLDVFSDLLFTELFSYCYSSFACFLAAGLHRLSQSMGQIRLCKSFSSALGYAFCAACGFLQKTGNGIHFALHPLVVFLLIKSKRGTAYEKYIGSCPLFQSFVA